jgi:hypothetical protein
MNLEAQRLEVTNGPPCENEYLDIVEAAALTGAQA